MSGHVQYLFPLIYKTYRMVLLASWAVACEGLASLTCHQPSISGLAISDLLADGTLGRHLFLFAALMGGMLATSIIRTGPVKYTASKVYRVAICAGEDYIAALAEEKWQVMQSAQGFAYSRTFGTAL